jgi:hypothetical protein
MNKIEKGDYFIYRNRLELCIGHTDRGWIVEYGGFAPLDPEKCVKISTKGFIITIE